MRHCLDVTTLMAFANAELPGVQAAEVEGHVLSCRRCAAALAKLPVDDELVSRLRDLERAREGLASAVNALEEVQQRVTTTLFGDG